MKCVHAFVWIFSATAASAASPAKEVPVTWTVYPGYTDTRSLPGNTIVLSSAIAGDGLVLAVDGGSVYTDRALDRHSQGVQASIKPSTNDAVLTVSSPRSLKLNLASFLGS